MRVYVLAKELKVESKLLLEICKELGYEHVKNQLSNLETDQADAVVARIKKGTAKPAAHAPAGPAVLPQGSVSTKVQTLSGRRPAAGKTGDVAPIAEKPSPVADEVPAETAATKPATSPAEPQPIVADAPTAATTPAKHEEPTPAQPQPAVVAADAPAAPAAPAAKPTTLPPRPSTFPPRPTTMGQETRPMRNIRGTPRTEGGGPAGTPGGAQPGATGPTPPRGPRLPGSIRMRHPSGQPSFAPRPNQSSLRDTKPGAAPPPPKDTGVRKITGLSADQMKQGRNLTVESVMKGPQAQSFAPGTAPAPDVADDDGKDKRPGAVPGRDQRRALRTDRAKKDVAKDTAKGVQVQGGRVTLLDDDRPLRIRDRLKKRPHSRQPGTQPRKGNVQVTVPITVRVLSEAVGLTVPKLLKKLMEPPYEFKFGTVTINSVLDEDVAQLVAADLGCELEIRRQQDAEEELHAKHKEVDDPAHLVPRAPVVAIMGHVDHGKTSLLDKIRSSNVAAGEVGGITQVIRAWQVVHDGKPITFLDTPGHEAFTKMRARGAQVTDIAVIVCAADDGVMPQTEEAINHAKAAGVSIVIAINKVDLPNANLNKTRQQLYSLSILPDNMGGDVPFVETSAAKGTGIDELLEAILVVAELKELTANPSKPGRGTCLEAHLSGIEGVQTTLLVQDGTLRKGDIVLCGPAQGRVRAMYNDLGAVIESAGPGVPVRITGLDVVPHADDPFAVVDDITVAREIAEKRHNKRQEDALNRFVPKVLPTLGEIKVSELKVILKADFRGSVEAIRKELEKLTHEEVRVRVLHAGIGGITASDVQLAMTSPTDTMIVGFNAVPDDEARALAEQLGVPIREYSIIYNLTDDIRAALEGRLKPREEIVYLGRAIVREVFKISKVGTVAGCHVTNGVIERSAKIRLIRGGVVIYPPADRTAGLESLKHHKDDVRDIKQGYDCGIKVANYDDIKVDDVIEAYRIDEIKRTL